jgi:hypothetical protein
MAPQGMRRCQAGATGAGMAPRVGCERRAGAIHLHPEDKNAAKRPGANKGGREEEENRPGIASWPQGQEVFATKKGKTGTAPAGAVPMPV